MSKLPPEVELRMLRSRVAALEELLLVQEQTVAEQSELLRSAVAAANDATRAKSEFLANMSHELRTPLNSVIGFARVLKKNKTDNLVDGQLRQLDRIERNGQHLLTLINDILDLAKVEAGKVEVHLAPIDAGGLIQDVLSQLAGGRTDDAVTTTAEVGSQAVHVVSDPDRLRQVLINLIGNALKFTEQGSVTVRLLPGPRPAIEVVDTGPGMSAEQLERVFIAFEQADGSTSRRFGGTGLGLSISSSLCQLLDHGLEVESEVGQGSTFRLRFREHQVASDLPVVAPAAVLPQLRDIAGLRVLIIDDEAESRALLTEQLQELGAQVIEVSSPLDGERLALATQPDLITLDLHMPEMHGFELLQRLKANPELSDIPVIIVSGSQDGQRAFGMGAVGFLSKPVCSESLERTIRNSTGRKIRSILVVDDEQDARELIAVELANRDLIVRFAEDGVAAFEQLEDFEPDLVLLDLLMPRMDGMTFLSQLRSPPRANKVPVVVLTSSDLTDLEAQRLRELAGGVLAKSAGLDHALQLLFGETSPPVE